MHREKNHSWRGTPLLSKLDVTEKGASVALYNWRKETMSAFSETALETKLKDLNQSQQSIQTLSLWLIHHRKHAKKIVLTWKKLLVQSKFARFFATNLFLNCSGSRLYAFYTLIYLLTVAQPKKLTFLYLANDVIQTSKKKGPEFSQEFEGKCRVKEWRIFDASCLLFQAKRIQNASSVCYFSLTSNAGVLPYAFHHVLKDADEKTRGSCIRLLNIWQERGVYDSGFIQAIKQTKEPVKQTKESSSSSSAGGGGGAKGRNEIVPILKNSRQTDVNSNENPSRKGDPWH